MKRLVFALALGLVPASLAGQAPEVVITPLSGPVHTIRLIRPDGSDLGARMVLARDEDGILLVDTSFPSPPLTRLIRSRLGGDPRWVVVTHWHPDHSGGIAGFTADARVLAHPVTKRRLAEETVGIDLAGPGTRFVSPRRDPAGLPNAVVADSLQLRLGGETIRIVHYPASHTDGDLAIFFESSGVVAAGDLYWPGRFPSVDVVNGGNALGLAETIEAILARTPDGATIVPGHGDPTGREALASYHRMLVETIGLVRDRVRAGASLEQVQARGLGEAWAGWAHPLVPEDQWIALVVRSLEAREEGSGGG